MVKKKIQYLMEIFIFYNSECSKGNYTCFTSFGTNLSDDQLHLMKEELLQVFNFQHNHNDHAHVDIRHIRDNPAERK